MLKELALKLLVRYIIGVGLQKLAVGAKLAQPGCCFRQRCLVGRWAEARDGHWLWGDYCAHLVTPRLRPTSVCNLRRIRREPSQRATKIHDHGPGRCSDLYKFKSGTKHGRYCGCNQCLRQ